MSDTRETTMSPETRALLVQAVFQNSRQARDLLAAKNLTEYLRRLDAAGFARLAGAMQSEATGRGMLAAVAPLGDAQSAAEDFARDGR